MIQTKAALKYYLSEDRRVYGKVKPNSIKEHIVDWLFPDANYKFMVCLRHLEYHLNRGGVIHKLLTYYYQLKRSYWQRKTMTDLKPNTAGPGLHIVHGKVQINVNAKLGANCKINSDVTIGAAGRYDRYGAPQIGNRVYVGTGARILGNIRIADDVVIGANAVVIKDILEPGTTWGGIPARKLSDQGSAPYLRLPKDDKP